MKRTIRQIVKESVESEKLQLEWERQLVTAEEIVKRHEQGLGTVLLADEVGMGKTYVALAVIANHVFQTDENDRKVLLVVPPNNILARKWEQEIRTFNEKYIHESLRKDVGKRLRPKVVTDYWDMIQNLHDFQNQDTPRVSSVMLECFARAAWNWNDRRPKKKVWRKEWDAYGKLKPHSLEYLQFCSWYSPRAISDFLDDEFDANPLSMTQMIDELNNGDLGYGLLKNLFRKFGKNQDYFEANVFVIGMSALRKSRSDKVESQLLTTYIASCLLKGRWEDTRKAALKQLVKHNFCFVPSDMSANGNPHLRWFTDLCSINLWGMYEAVCEVIKGLGDLNVIVDRILDGDKLDHLFKTLQAQVISLKLNKSGIDLTVVDEVHNWKSGNNGANEFKERYASAIQNKLIMSATPFQLHQDELGRIFEIVAKPGDKSIDVVNNLLKDGTAKNCLEASEQFLRSWKVLGNVDHIHLLEEIDRINDVLEAVRGLSIRTDISEQLGSFLDSIIKYKDAISALQNELSQIIIRHTKNRDKRHFHAGREFAAIGIPDYTKVRRSLYAVPGYGSPSNALLNFLAMRVDQLVRRDTQVDQYESNAHLLGGITSSNKAFLDSNEKLLSNDMILPTTKNYLQFFKTSLQKNQHPKVEATVDRAFDNFRQGRKTLIFCERLGTQEEILSTLKKLIDEKIFPNGGIEQAQKDRAAILKDHQVVELFWSRSYLATLDVKIQGILKKHLLELSPKLIALVVEKITELNTHINQRQEFKLLDLAMLQEIGNQPGMQLGVIAELFNSDITALKQYLRIKVDHEPVPIDDAPLDSEQELDDISANKLEQILEAPSIWYSTDNALGFHKDLWHLIDSELRQLNVRDRDHLYVMAGILLDLGQGLRKVLLRLDLLQGFDRSRDESISTTAIRMLTEQKSWKRAHEFVEALLESEGTLSRKSEKNSKRQSLWKGVFLRDERIASELNGSVAADTRVNICAAFNSPLLPDILICTSIGSEGIDLHRHCAEVIHHDLPWNPAKLEQRTGRVDRVGSLAEKMCCKNYFRLNIGIPFLAHNYEKYQYEKLHIRAQNFEILLGKPEFPTDVEDEHVIDTSGNETVIEVAAQEIDRNIEQTISLPDKVVEYLKMDLSVYQAPYAIG
ncbi:MAG: helicase-related protein [Methylotenera sp.]